MTSQPLDLPTSCSPDLPTDTPYLQELFWSPFRSTVAVSEQSWHGELAGYGLAGEQTEEQWREDPDRNLLSAVTEKVLLLSY